MDLSWEIEYSRKSILQQISVRRQEVCWQTYRNGKVEGCFEIQWTFY